jgi:peptidyl-prolyl cis-trans isomerase C
VLRSELDESIDLFLKSQGGSREQVPAQMLPQLEYQMLNQIVDGILVMNVLSESDGEKLTEESAKEFEAFKTRFDDEAKYQEMLDKLGMSEEILKKQIREGIAQKIMIDNAKAEAGEISEEQAKAFYDGNAQYWERPEMVNARHILIKAEKAASAEEKAAAKKSAEAARKRIAGGEDFAAVAKDVSDDPGSAARGGMLPPFTKGQMVPEFEKVAFGLASGKLSPVFQSDFGYHFLEVMNKQDAGTMTYEEVSPKIKENLQAGEVRKDLQQQLESLRTDADIEILIPEPEQAAMPGMPGMPPQSQPMPQP